MHCPSPALMFTSASNENLSIFPFSRSLMRGRVRQAMFCGLFLRPTVFADGIGDVHHQAGAQPHIGGLGRRVAQCVKYGGESLAFHYFFSRINLL